MDRDKLLESLISFFKASMEYCDSGEIYNFHNSVSDVIEDIEEQLSLLDIQELRGRAYKGATTGRFSINKKGE